MIEFFRSLFGLRSNSGNTAKERLRLVLLSDHLSLEPDLVDSLKRDLLEVIARYVEIDSNNADITFEHRDREIAMLASVPVTGVRRPEPPVLKAVPDLVPPEPEGPPAPEVHDEAENPMEVSAPIESSVEPAPVEPEPEPVAVASPAHDGPQQSNQAPRPRRRRRRRATMPAPIAEPPGEGSSTAAQA